LTRASASISLRLGAVFGLSGFTSRPTVTGAGNKFAQQIEALHQHLSADQSHARDVSARTTEAIDETQLDRIGAEPENGIVAVAALAANGTRTEPIAMITATRC
jgi:hypothetical protein